MSDDPDRLIPLVRVLALSAALDPADAALVADQALRERPEENDPAARTAGLDETVRRIAREHAKAQGGRRSPLVELPADAAERAAGARLDLPAVFAGVEPDATAYMLLEAANRVPGRYRIPLLLTLIEGLSPVAVARIIGGTSDEVEATLVAALRLYEREIRFAIREGS